jgi:hypothetical protein
MKTTIKALDHYDHLQAGHTYNVHSLVGSRLIVLTDVVSLQVISLYRYQLEEGTLRGKLMYVDSTQSLAMSCTAVASLCKKLDSGYAY